MFRYIGFAWDSPEPRVSQTAQILVEQLRHRLPELQCAFAAPGLAVYCNPGPSSSFGMHSVAQQGGVVLGRLFPRKMEENTAPDPVRLDGAVGRQILRSAGRDLLRDYWGQYVAFLHDRASSSSFVIRDPTGGIPCYLTSHRGIEIFFSHLQDCLSLGLTDFTVNWRYVTARMIMQLLEGADTGLNEVSQLIPGDCRVLPAGGAVRNVSYWNLVRISQSDPIEDLEVATTQARKTVRACVAAWASGYEHILQRLSGGLDSSILLSCLRQAPSRPKLACVHHFERSVWGDERQFAHSALRWTDRTAAAPCDLVELERRPEDVSLRAAMQSSPSAFPGRYVASHEVRRLDIPVANKSRAAVFTGTHGDGVFFTKKSFSAVDYFHRHGFGAELLRTAHLTAQSLGCSVWGLLPTVIRDGLRARRRPYRFQDDVLRRIQGCQFVDAAVLESFSASGEAYFNLPGLKDTDRLAPGKISHLRILSLPASATNHFGQPEDPDWIMPLASQPVIELFSRIPSYVLTAGGQDRAVARRAFAGELPPEILTRHSKAFGNHFHLELFRRNVAIYQEVLLEGILVRERLLDRRKVEHFFATARDPGAKGLVEILQSHFNLELWLRSWTGAQRASNRMAAA